MRTIQWSSERPGQEGSINIGTTISTNQTDKYNCYTLQYLREWFLNGVYKQKKLFEQEKHVLVFNYSVLWGCNTFFDFLLPKAPIWIPKFTSWVSVLVSFSPRPHQPLNIKSWICSINVIYEESVTPCSHAFDTLISDFIHVSVRCHILMAVQRC